MAHWTFSQQFPRFCDFTEMNDFQTKGYSHYAQVIASDKCAEIEHVVAGIEEEGMRDGDCFLESRNGKPKQLQSLHYYRPQFFNDLFQSAVYPLLVSLFADEYDLSSVEIRNVQLFMKWSGASGPTNCHQDDFYFNLDLSQKLAVVCWISLNGASKESGCLCYEDGSHQLGLLSHSSNENGVWRIRTGVEGYAGYVQDRDVTKLTSCETKAGDVLVHHCRTIHGALPNTSATPVRKALTFICILDKK